MPPDPSPEELRGSLSGLGVPFRFFAEIGSTNDEALAWARADAPEGAVVVADAQTAGRGRRGRTWEAKRGTALLFSVVLRPRLEPHDLGLVPLAVGLAVADAAGSLTGASVDVKWPNDVLIEERKVAGVLAESVVGGGRVAAVVAGVGINVLAAPALGAEAVQPAGSLAEAAARRGLPAPSRSAVLKESLSAIARWCRFEDAGARRSLVAAANDRMTFLGRPVTVTTDDAVVEGVAVKVLEDGALQLDVDGRGRTVRVGDVRRVRAR